MAAGTGPLFKQIAQAIGDAIERGAVAVGEMLPTEKELAVQYGASRHTIRDALGELRALGLVESRQGKGTVVVRASRQSSYAQSYSSIEELTRFASGTPIHPVTVEDVLADAALASDLRCGVGQSFVRIVGLRYREDDTSSTPVGYVEVFIDASFGRIRAHLQDLKSSIAETLERLYEMRIFRIEQEISVMVLPETIAVQLQVASGTPAMLIRRRYVVESGRVVETAFSYYPIGQFEYRNVLLRNK
ncbi:MAG: GntR family transcriptional regulator [Rhodobacteraceae bacterium]|nr:GntR family transcriptional regulator [Paracoccaceae bacterium]